MSQSVSALRIGTLTTAPITVRISTQPLSAYSTVHEQVRLCH
jgi:hypothetical protein